MPVFPMKHFQIAHTSEELESTIIICTMHKNSGDAATKCFENNLNKNFCYVLKNKQDELPMDVMIHVVITVYATILISLAY